MGGLVLITTCTIMNMLAIQAYSCSCEIPGLSSYSDSQKSILANSRLLKYTGQLPLGYIPVCGPCTRTAPYNQVPVPDCHQQPNQQNQKLVNHNLAYIQQAVAPQPGSIQQASDRPIFHYPLQQQQQQHNLEERINSYQSDVTNQNFFVGNQQKIEDESVKETGEHKKDSNVHYKFAYAVNDQETGDIKRHTEERKGDVVRGEYSLVEEDGNVRTVQYYADWKTGFHAQVRNSKQKPA